MRKERIIAKIGMEVVTMLALMDDVLPTPMVKRHWLQTIAKRAAAASLKMSRRGMGDDLTKNDASQKRTAAPTARKKTMEMLSTPP